MVMRTENYNMIQIVANTLWDFFPCQSKNMKQEAICCSSKFSCLMTSNFMDLHVTKEDRKKKRINQSILSTATQLHCRALFIQFFFFVFDTIPHNHNHNNCCFRCPTSRRREKPYVPAGIRCSYCATNTPNDFWPGYIRTIKFNNAVRT